MQIKAEASGVGINITYFTDPLCCWSWAFDPEWQQIQHDYPGKINCTYRMGGLLPSWTNFNDPVNYVTRPIQMGPVWMQASHITGRHIEHSIWVKDPPASSYPACIAVKCAGLQGKHFEEIYLRMLWETVMLEGINIAKDNVLLQLSQLLADQSDDFDPELFRQSLYDGQGTAAFKEDLQLTQQYNITRFPAFVIRKPGEKPLLLRGLQPYSVWKDMLEQNKS